jgi:3-hydroxyacyl-CoA dehydrogenase
MQKKGRINSDRANRLKANITGSLTKDAFADAGFIIEAVFEDLDVKKKVFAEVEEFASSEAIFATNTSSLSITAMAADLKHPERVVGFHFFNPVAVMPLLEIARGTKTDEPTLATAFEVGKKLKKSIVFVKDAPAFVVNRLLTRFLGEVTRAIDEGTPYEVADKALDPLGLPMTPLLLMALVGPAVAFHVSETLNAAFPDRFYVSQNMGKIVGLGKSAIWDWSTGSPQIDPEILAVVVQGDAPLTAEQVKDRALNALAEEVNLMLKEGVVADVRDIDMSMLLGAGWPFWLGGITPYLDRAGVSERVTGHRFLPSGVASL